MTPKQEELWALWGQIILERTRAMQHCQEVVLSEILKDEWGTQIVENDRNELGKAFKRALLNPAINASFAHLIPIGVDEHGANIQRYKRRQP